MKSLKIHINRDEKGLVSLVVTMIIILVLSITVIGFAQLMRREQRQALDRQLNTQAFYAAESGVNDAVKILKTIPNAKKPACDNSGITPNTAIPLFTALIPNLDNGVGTISYSCVTVDPAPTSLEYSNINTDKSKVVPVQTSMIMQYIFISWQDTSPNPKFTGCAATRPNPAFTAGWPADCPGVLRVDIVPTGGGGIDRDSLANSTMTAFLYPIYNGLAGVSQKALTGGFGNQGSIEDIQCSGSAQPLAPKQCKARISVSTTTRYYLRLKSIYNPSSVTVTASNDGNTPLPLEGAQAIVDSTGKANDVLKRIQVRVPTSTIDGFFPEFPIEGLGSICKRLAIIPPSTVQRVPLTAPDDPVACTP